MKKIITIMIVLVKLTGMTYAENKWINNEIKTDILKQEKVIAPNWGKGSKIMMVCGFLAFIASSENSTKAKTYRNEARLLRDRAIGANTGLFGNRGVYNRLILQAQEYDKKADKKDKSYIIYTAIAVSLITGGVIIGVDHKNNMIIQKQFKF